MSYCTSKKFEVLYIYNHHTLVLQFFIFSSQGVSSLKKLMRCFSKRFWEPLWILHWRIPSGWIGIFSEITSKLLMYIPNIFTSYVILLLESHEKIRSWNHKNHYACHTISYTTMYMLQEYLQYTKFTYFHFVFTDIIIDSV